MKLLVAVDGSPASLRAVEMAISFAKQRTASTIILLNVQNQTMLNLAEGIGFMSAAWIEDEEDRLGEEAVGKAVAACDAAGIPFAVSEVNEERLRKLLSAWRARKESIISSWEHVDWGASEVFSPVLLQLKFCTWCTSR